MTLLTLIVGAIGMALMLRGFWFAAQIGFRYNLSVLGLSTVDDAEAQRGDRLFWGAMRNLAPGVLLVIVAATVQGASS